MTLYLKVPPLKGKYMCVVKFTSPHLEKNVFQYLNVAIYNDNKYDIRSFDMAYRPISYNMVFKELKEDTNPNIVVCNSGFHPKEQLFKASLLHYDPNIPLIDQMICAYYKIAPIELTYKKTKIQTPQVSEALLLELLGNKPLTRQERKALGFNDEDKRNGRRNKKI